MPQITIVAEPNGAGKSTIASYLLPNSDIHLNADEFAKELKAPGNSSPDMAAGRHLLQRWNTLEQERADFAVETTFASNSYAQRLKRMKAVGYRFHLIFIWIPNSDIAVERVRERVMHGGHYIPEEVIRRRYVTGLRNFFSLYQPIANSWRFFDNSKRGLPSLIAKGSLNVQKEELWIRLQTEWA